MHHTVTPPQLPFDLEAEEAAIGVVLNNGKPAFLALRDIVGVEHFYFARTAAIWQTFERLATDHRVFDLVMVMEMLSYMGVLEDIGGPAHIFELVKPLYPMSEIDTIAGTLHDVYLQRASS